MRREGHFLGPLKRVWKATTSSLVALLSAFFRNPSTEICSPNTFFLLPIMSRFLYSLSLFSPSPVSASTDVFPRALYYSLNRQLLGDKASRSPLGPRSSGKSLHSEHFWFIIGVNLLISTPKVTSTCVYCISNVYCTLHKIFMSIAISTSSQGMTFV